MCIAICWVDSSYNIHEAVLGLVQLLDTKALTLFGIIKDVLVRCSLPITDCIGQAYDGASNMSDVQNGIQALMKKESDLCLYVHCFAHSLNVCVQGVTRKSSVTGADPGVGPGIQGTSPPLQVQYRKRRNIGDTFNLAIWRLSTKSPN